MNVYIIFHNVMHEGSEPVSQAYSSAVEAQKEALRLHTEYVNKRTAHWNTLSKSDQRMYGPLHSYIDNEGWSVETFEVI